MISDIGRTRHDLYEFSEIRRASDRLQRPLALQPLGQRDLIDHFADIRQIQHRPIHFFVRRPIEIFLDQELHRFRHRAVVQENSPQDRLLRLQVLRRQFRLSEIDG